MLGNKVTPTSGKPPVDVAPAGGPLKGNPIGVAPAAAPAAAPRAFAPDSGYNDAVDFAQRRHDQTVGEVGDDTRKTKFEFGFDDPTNPFSRVNEAKKLFLASGRRNGTVMGSMGSQLFSGANQRALARNQRNEAANTAQMRAAYEAALEALKRRGTAADNTLEADKAQALREAMERQGL